MNKDKNTKQAKPILWSRLKRWLYGFIKSKKFYRRISDVINFSAIVLLCILFDQTALTIFAIVLIIIVVALVNYIEGVESNKN